MRYLYFVLFVGCSVFGAEVALVEKNALSEMLHNVTSTETPLQKLGVSANKLVKRFSSENEQKYWDNKLKEGYAQAEKDNQVMNWDIYLQNKVLNMIAEKESEFFNMLINDCFCALKKKDAIEICRLIVYCVKNNIDLPQRVSSELDEKRIDIVIKFLDNKQEFKK